MLWPIILPFNLTCVILTTLVALCALIAPRLHWGRRRTLAIAVPLAVVAFIPSMKAVKALVDSYRFGIFDYDAYSDVNDWRIERYLPPKALQITLDKYPQGHRAKYTITEAELMEFLDGLWEKYGDRSARSRDELHSDTYFTGDQRRQFGDLGWPVLENAIELHSPVKSNWAGATYYFDRESGTAYHRAGYW